ncbi:Methyl-accepting chemotaxis protein PctB [Vibrio aerogenes CECT 7868]|uniref:Methyl-accepting chemotaxis protein PctB n=1 Tax=Vibrio aerogenes CECT 7868 TaxID=1216006 RepID=A0A1M5XVA7_9VIBR|nr:methyl-accepting chemotaxis protein [Vibrio aerogenes]SHI03183.1 Methyl-accepting chemotaxis protein PctB [Vibrio aerogenes CECT 7868]
MNQISIKSRLYILVLVPLILLTLGMAYLTNVKMAELSQMQIQDVRKQLVALKEDTLKTYIEIIDSALIPLKKQNASREEAIKKLSGIKYGQNGYIFGYDSRGNRIFQGDTNKDIGKNFWDARDTRNNLFIQDIIRNGKNGGGFSHYFFPKPGGSVAKEKWSYSIYQSQWDIIIGTGFYIDDIDDTVVMMQQLSDKKSAESFVSILLLCGGISAIVGIFGFFIVRSVLSPLKQFDHSIAEFASGHADLTARMQAFTLPEFNSLSTNFNQFVSTLQSIIKSVTESSLTISGETKTMTEQANESDLLALRQREETEQVATAMTEMTTTANEISQNAHQAAQSAQTVDNRARDAMQTVSDAVDSVGNLAGQIDQANSIVCRLAGNVNDISASLDVIQDIAEQTNLLALNAAIEAARAGEQGRGFAVVADEVRKLASRTQTSTREITDILEQLKVATNDAVSAMDESKDQSEQTVTQANSAGQALQDIIHAIEIIMDMNSLIATATNEQNHVGQDISQRIVIISDQSYQSASLTENTRRISDKLSHQAEELKQLINKFTV